jgi:hypothetical protein
VGDARDGDAALDDDGLLGLSGLYLVGDLIGPEDVAGLVVLLGLPSDRVRVLVRVRVAAHRSAQ